MLKNQVPPNIKSTPTVDLFVTDILNETDPKDHIFDGSLARLGKKVTDIFGPLSKIWEAEEACIKRPTSTWLPWGRISG